jgi:hypothetical protein
MTARRLVSVVLGATLAFVLSGCQVSVLGVIGLTATEGRMKAIVVTCSDYTSDEVHINRIGQFFLIPEPSWRFDRAQTTTVDLADIDDFLEYIGDSDMDIQASTSGGLGGGGGYIRFDRSEIEQLRDGDILLGVPLSRGNEIVDAAGFEESAQKYCARFS